MKKAFKNILISMGLLAGVAACDVNRLPETNISDLSFWTSESDIKAANNYLYTFLPGFNNDDVWSDDAFGLASNTISDGSRLAPATAGNDYNAPYNLIRAANNILEKAPRATVSPAVLDRYLAEARFFRGWAYFSLVQKYGSVPLILKTLDENSPELTEAPASRETLLDQIYSDLDFAIVNLPTITALGNIDYGRISKTAAQAFKARVALFEGTFSKFHNQGNAAAHLTLARDAAKAVIDSKEHALFGSYFDLFQMAGEGRQNKENIIVKQYGVSSTERVLTHSYYRSSLETGNVNPTKSLADSYLMKDGLPITKSPLWMKPDSSQKVFKNRDARMSATFMKRGDPMMTTKPIFDIANLVFNKTGYMFRKFANIEDWNTQASVIDRPLLRYAEVLLIFAEATYELNNAITDAELDMSVNLLRDRGQVARLSNAFVKANALDMREEIRRERRVELAQEGFRYWDLIRWKIAETELVKPVLGNFYFKTEFAAATVNLTPDNIILVQDASFRKFNPAKDYLWPIPINEIALNPNLQQNTGW
ncbi:RagB/SusD family nutrient uptake outer membrane protein [Dyadobacter sandarakinus]|uniref:RagB/SusD family nutrient uptake outer membrane protein n=1 Tax=Dyadobacter sandarakinus TaxID=2747268 RepID=A0ABX7I7D5_9BACT|nr:RagB/SusD family nutrient uptake outer membrane protein [Dyadobacter sandarakinus]QRR01800.1 RagB/SusD family nutrient uptake outer membrane protein [Dyadobacter sandarakinus]